ncbi:hypothetical protein B0J14DRAFT_590691 [Halenospora varia]|nr:hypothetical protein B0J14DRAFT_590691 [Halenospora varia]
MRMLHSFVLVIMPVNHLDSCATAQAASIFLRPVPSETRTLAADDRVISKLPSLTRWLSACTSNRVIVKALILRTYWMSFAEAACDGIPALIPLERRIHTSLRFQVPIWPHSLPWRDRKVTNWTSKLIRTPTQAFHSAVSTP